MKRLKHIILLFLFFSLFGCGADINYDLNVDTEEQTILINIELRVNESDYKYIDGGREKLISVINLNKPDDLEFSIDSENENKYIFTLSFDNYEEYKEKYHNITGVETKNIFEISEFSKETPFIANQNLEFNDDLVNLLNWLKSSLIDSNAVSVENSEKMIGNQTYNYVYDEDKSYSNQYEKNKIIHFDESKLLLLFKRENKLDIEFTFNVENDKNTNLTKNLRDYLKNKGDIKYNHEEIEENNIEYDKYSVSIEDLNLDDSKSLQFINSIFGENFCDYTYTKNNESSFLKNIFNQSLSIDFNFYNLFDRDVLDKTEVIIDIDNMSIDTDKMNDIKLPIKSSDLVSGSYHVSLNTTYSTIKYFTIIFIIIIITILLLLIKKYGFKNKNIKLRIEIKNIMNYINDLSKKYLYDNNIELGSKIIKGKNYYINLENINKVNYAMNLKILKLLKGYILAFICMIFFIRINYIFGALIIFLISLPVLLIIINNFKIKVINVELTSGKLYSLLLDTEDKTIELYDSIMKLLDEKDED